MQSQLEQSPNDLSRRSEAEAEEAWQQIAPLLDGAMGQLGQKDHDALVLRFFEGRNFKEVGAALGAGEDAAKMRVNRALEKLRKFFTKHGISSTTATIAGTISANSVQAAPVALAKAVMAIAVAKGATASGSILTLIKGALKLMAWTKAKTAIVLGILVITVVGTTVVVTHHKSRAVVSPGLGSINLINTQLEQVLGVYKAASGLDLTLSPEVKRLSPLAGIVLKADQIDNVEMAKLIEKALFEQAGIVITKNGNKAVVTYNGMPIVHPVRPFSSPKLPVPQK